MSGTVNGNSELRTFVENALLETFSKIFRVNVNTGEYEVFKSNGLLDGDGLLESPDIYAYMRKLIDDGIIYPEYATACRRFTNPEYVRKSVFSGERRIVQSYRRRTPRGDKWITFAIVVLQECSPENPMVLFTWREADSDAITLLDTLPSISSLYDKLIRINLSNNTYEPVIVDADEQERLVGGVINMREWWASYSTDGNIAPEDVGVFSTLTRTDSLQKRFAEDPTPVNFRYRRKVGDEFRWVQLQIAPSVEYSEENQIMLLSLKDIHEEYTAEIRSRQELIDNMNRDALTGLFNRLKFNADIGAFKSGDGPVFTCLYVDVNGLHELNNLLGHQKGDEMLCCVAGTLSRYFPDDLVYRIGGDEFVVLSTALSRAAVELVIDQVRRDLRKENYEISIGVGTGACGEEVEKIVAAAEREMRGDKTAYYLRNGDRRKGRQMNEQLEQMLAEKHDKDRFLDSIADLFTAVYFVDPVKDTLRHIYSPDLFVELFKETDSHFIAAVRLYVDRYVKPEYQGLFEDVLDYDRLDTKLAQTECVQIAYEKTNGARMNLRISKVGEQRDARSETLWILREETR